MSKHVHAAAEQQQQQLVAVLPECQLQKCHISPSDTCIGLSKKHVVVAGLWEQVNPAGAVSTYCKLPDTAD
jgi:hypothetical protein